MYQKSQSWCTVSMIWSTADRVFFHSGPFFTLLPYNNQENKNFEKMKKTLGDIIILHMMYGSWDMECHGQNFCHRTIFCPFTLLMTKKIKFWKNEKKTFEDILHKCFKNHDMCLTVPEIQPLTDIIFIFNFELFSVLLPLWQPKKSIKKNEKNPPRDIIILHMCTKNYDHMLYGSWDIVHARQTDRKSDKQRGWCPIQQILSGCHNL